MHNLYLMISTFYKGLSDTHITVTCWWGRLPWKSLVWSPSRSSVLEQDVEILHAEDALELKVSGKGKKKKVNLKCVLVLFELKRFSLDQDMNRQSDNGHFTPTVVLRGPLLPWNNQPWFGSVIRNHRLVSIWRTDAKTISEMLFWGGKSEAHE